MQWVDWSLPFEFLRTTLDVGMFVGNQQAENPSGIYLQMSRKSYIILWGFQLIRHFWWLLFSPLSFCVYISNQTSCLGSYQLSFFCFLTISVYCHHQSSFFMILLLKKKICAIETWLSLIFKSSWVSGARSTVLIHKKLVTLSPFYFSPPPSQFSALNGPLIIMKWEILQFIANNLSVKSGLQVQSWNNLHPHPATWLKEPNTECWNV